ncbi:MAG: hypothetical protein LKJ69_08380 [Lactobacillus sp.]|nr:hypothetical protein [Lactobacillus sp.]MCI2033407.1 hypothetical protein [Lactobacillus sp.]
MADRIQTLRFAGIIADAKIRLVLFPDGRYRQLDTVTLGAYYYFDSHGNPLDWPAWTLLVEHNGEFLKALGSASIGDFLKIKGKLVAVNLVQRLSDRRKVNHLWQTRDRFVKTQYLTWLSHLKTATPVLAATHAHLTKFLTAYDQHKLSLDALLTRSRRYLATHDQWLLNDFQGLLADLEPVRKATQVQIDALMPPAFLVTKGRQVKTSSQFDPDWHPRKNDPARSEDEAYRHEQFQQIMANHAYRLFHQLPFVPATYFRGKKFWPPEAISRFDKPAKDDDSWHTSTSS